MKSETRKRKFVLWLRKRGLMLLSAMVWHLDDWVHRQQVKLRNELSDAVPLRPAPAILRAGSEPDRAAARARVHFENFEQWEARKSGVAVISKKEARRRGRLTVAEFDRRFA